MIKIILLIALIPLLFINSQSTGRVSNPPQEVRIESQKLDQRAEILQAYLSKHNSPLQYHSQDFIEAADKYNLDWKLVPAIAGVESTFGKRIPGGYEPGSTSYNGWGWAIYNSDSRYGFKSWRDGIFEVSQGLREDYINDGLVEPLAMNKRYAASPTWGVKVNYFLGELDKQAKVPVAQKTVVSVDTATQTAGVSAELKSI